MFRTVEDDKNPSPGAEEDLEVSSAKVGSTEASIGMRVPTAEVDDQRPRQQNTRRRMPSKKKPPPTKKQTINLDDKRG